MNAAAGSSIDVDALGAQLDDMPCPEHGADRLVAKLAEQQSRSAGVLAVLDAHAEGIEQAYKLARGKTRDEIAAGLREFREATAIVVELAELAKRAIPLLQDDADRYEDDGSNEPLECIRALESALARFGGAA